MSLRNREELAALFKIFRSHKEHLNKKALEAIDKNKVDEARIERAKALDIDRILDLINNRIRECAKGGR